VNLIKSDWHDNITEISKYLIEPAAGYIHNSDIVYLIPQEILYNYPLHMLMLNGRSLIENNPVVYDSSTSVLKYQRRNKKSDLKNISIGVGFVKEAEEVSEIIKGELISEEKACKNKIYNYLKDKGIIHFSCHGCYNEKDPLSSGLLLHDGILASRDIFNFKLDAEIVTLSACDTGTNKRTNGDELVGLTRAFLYAGADSVLVSLWKAYAEPTEIFMSEFYGSFINGDTKARAYQKAVIKLKDKYDDFYYWAPFVLYGDCD
jgi:CHAT domain-containing protein